MVFEEYQSVESFAEYAQAEDLAEASWQDIAELVYASPEPLARTREVLANAPIAIAASPSLLAETERQAIASMRQAHAQNVVRALRSHGLRIAERNPGDFDPWKHGEEEMANRKQQSAYALLCMLCGQGFGAAVPDSVKGRLQAYKRDGLPGKPEDKRCYAQKLLVAAIAVADAGETTEARKLIDQAMVTLSEIPAEAPKVETPAETPAA
jgi:hypothetical protein